MARICTRHVQAKRKHVEESNEVPSTNRYEPSARVVQAEGARVSLVTCKDCGVTLALDPDISFDVLAIHDDFHNRVDR